LGRFLLRLHGALVLTFATYNPSGHSCRHWVVEHFPSFNVWMALAGTALLMGWAVYLGPLAAHLVPGA
jgi:hypothetical protein